MTNGSASAPGYPCCQYIPVPRQWKITNIETPGNKNCSNCVSWTSDALGYILDPQASATCGLWELFNRDGPCSSGSGGMDLTLTGEIHDAQGWRI